MDNVIIIRYSEIHLKGKNRGFFENLLKQNIREKLRGMDCTEEFVYGRYVVSGYAPKDENRIINALCKVFGIFSLSRAVMSARRRASSISSMSPFMKSVRLYSDSPMR